MAMCNGGWNCSNTSRADRADQRCRELERQVEDLRRQVRRAESERDDEREYARQARSDRDRLDELLDEALQELDPDGLDGTADRYGDRRPQR